MLLRGKQSVNASFLKKSILMGLNMITGINVLLHILHFDNEQIVFWTCHIIPECIIWMELGIIWDYSYTFAHFFFLFYAIVTQFHHTPSLCKKKKRNSGYLTHRNSYSVTTKHRCSPLS